MGNQKASREWCARAQNAALAEVFCNLNNQANIAISPGAVNSLVKQAAQWLGLEKVTGHSLRIGGCTAACAAGVPMSVIRSIGGWHSDAMELYIRGAAAPALRVSEKMGF